MDCAEEVATLKGALRHLVPEEQLGFDVLNGRMSVPATVAAESVVAAVAATGMRAEPWVEAREPEVGHAWSSRDAFVVASGLGTAAGFGVHAALAGLSSAMGSEGAGIAEVVPWPARMAYGVAIAAGLWVVVPKAWYALRNFRPDMNLLMTIAVAGAMALGEWFEAATVAWLFSLSLALEAWSVGRARRAVAALMKLAPTGCGWCATAARTKWTPRRLPRARCSACGLGSASASTAAWRAAPRKWIRRRSPASPFQ